MFDGVEEGGVTVVGEFDLDLGPSRCAAAAREPNGPDLVDTEFGEERPVGAEQMVDVARGMQSDDGDEFRLPDPGAQQRGEAAREGVGERGPDLVTDPMGDGEFEVPARVVAAGAATQGEESAASRWSSVS